MRKLTTRLIPLLQISEVLARTRKRTSVRYFPLNVVIGVTVRLYWTGLLWLTFERLSFSHSQYEIQMMNLLYLEKKGITENLTQQMCFISFCLVPSHFVGVMLNVRTRGWDTNSK